MNVMSYIPILSSSTLNKWHKIPDHNTVTSVGTSNIILQSILLPWRQGSSFSKTLVPTYKTKQCCFQRGGNRNSGTVHTKYRWTVTGYTTHASDIIPLLVTWTLTKIYKQIAMVDAKRLVTWSCADKTLMIWQMLSVLAHGNQQINDCSCLAPTS